MLTAIFVSFEGMRRAGINFADDMAVLGCDRRLVSSALCDADKIEMNVCCSLLIVIPRFGGD